MWEGECYVFCGVQLNKKEEGISQADFGQGRSRRASITCARLAAAKSDQKSLCPIRTWNTEPATSTIPPFHFYACNPHTNRIAGTRVRLTEPHVTMRRVLLVFELDGREAAGGRSSAGSVPSSSRCAASVDSAAGI